MKTEKTEITAAKSIIAGQSTPKNFAELKGLVGELKAQREFGWAHQVLKTCSKQFLEPHLAQLAKAALRGRDFAGEKPPLFDETWLVQDVRADHYRAQPTALCQAILAKPKSRQDGREVRRDLASLARPMAATKYDKIIRADVAIVAE